MELSGSPAFRMRVAVMRVLLTLVVGGANQKEKIIIKGRRKKRMNKKHLDMWKLETGTGLDLGCWRERVDRDLETEAGIRRGW